MAAKLCVGLTKKVGLPDFGSLGASCTVEFEIDGTLVQRDLDGFHRQAQTAFVACQQAVEAQLAQHRAHGDGHANGMSYAGHSSGNGAAANGSNGRRSSRNGRPATRSQARAIYAIANRQQIDLPGLLSQRFGVNQPEQLSISDASSLIDELNNPPAGSRS